MTLGWVSSSVNEFKLSKKIVAKQNIEQAFIELRKLLLNINPKISVLNICFQ